jgi:hypothetical protein
MFWNGLDLKDWAYQIQIHRLLRVYMEVHD